MKDILRDILKYTSTYDMIKIISTEDETIVQGCDDAAIYILHAKLKNVCADMNGVWGLSQLDTLKNLLDFTSYNTENAKFEIKSGVYKDTPMIEQFVFSDENGGSSTFRCMNPDRVKAQPEIRSIPWEFKFTPDASKVAEFTKLASIYKDMAKVFSVSSDNGELKFAFGEDTSSMHYAVMNFASGCAGKITGLPTFNTAQFLNLLRLPNQMPRVYVSNRGIIGVEIETDFATYMFYLRVCPR